LKPALRWLSVSAVDAAIAFCKGQLA
jgi:hypothetical protein